MGRTLPSFLKIILPTMLVLVALIVTVYAQRRGGFSRGSGWKFVAEKYDANNDGSVSLAEYTRGEAAFKALDTNSDGVLAENDWGKRTRRKGRDSAPDAGDVAPDFSLTQIDDPESIVTLSEFAGQKPVALLFGSCT